MKNRSEEKRVQSGVSVASGKRERRSVRAPMNPTDVVTWRVTSTINNTKVVITWYDRQQGKRVNRVKTAGSIGFKNAKRGTVYAAQEVIADSAKAYRERMNEVNRKSGEVNTRSVGSGGKNRKGKKRVGRHVLRRGMGRGRAVVLSELAKFTPQGLEVLSVSDATKDPHNGCRRKKARRV